MRTALWVLLAALVVVLGLSLTTGGEQTVDVTLRFNRDLILVLGSVALALAGVGSVAAWRAVRRRTHTAPDDVPPIVAHHRFLRRLDHELKNPLTAILVAVSNIRETCTPAEQQVLTSIETQTVRLSRLVRDLRKLAEIETLPLEEAVFDIRDLLMEAAALVQDADHGHRLTLRLPSAPDALRVRGDRDLLLVALHNLVDNALKFSGDEDGIELRAFREGRCVVTQVIDTGRGIPLADQPLVWEELYRGQNTDGVPGSGIGLSLAQLIVKRMHGEIALESAPGEGTTVTVRLPEAAPAAT